MTTGGVDTTRQEVPAVDLFDVLALAGILGKTMQHIWLIGFLAPGFFYLVALFFFLPSIISVRLFAKALRFCTRGYGKGIARIFFLLAGILLLLISAQVTGLVSWLIWNNWRGSLLDGVVMFGVVNVIGALVGVFVTSDKYGAALAPLRSPNLIPYYLGILVIYAVLPILG